MLNLLNILARQLEAAGSTEADREAKLLLANVLGIGTAAIPFYEEELTIEQQRLLKEMVSRRITGEPLQYILGKTEFMSLSLKINNHVLIPRNDTECIVEEAINLFKRHPLPKIADICTGSGAIAVSLACYLPYAGIWATDISKDAVRLAHENGSVNGVGSRIAFMTGDLFAPLSNRSFHLIIANPPYIPRNEITYLQKKCNGSLK